MINKKRFKKEEDYSITGDDRAREKTKLYRRTNLIKVKESKVNGYRLAVEMGSADNHLLIVKYMH